MKSILKMYAIDTLINFVVEYLASTVKNPTSPRAQGLFQQVSRLNHACTHFLDTIESNR